MEKSVNIYTDVLKNRSFSNLWLGQILSQIAMNMMVFVLAVRIYEVSHSNTAVSLMLLSFALPAVIFSPVAGVYADKLDRKFILVITNIVRAMIFFLFAYVRHSVPAILTFSLITSTITQFFAPAEAATIPSVVKRENLLAANSLFTITIFITMLGGFVLAGPFLRLFGNHGIFFFMGVLLSGAAISVSTIPSTFVRPTSSPVIPGFASSFKEIIEELFNGISYIVRNRKTILLPLFQITLTQVLISVLVVIAPGFAVTIIGIDIKDASYLLVGPAAVGMMLTVLFIGQIGQIYSRQKLITVGIFLGGSSLIILSFFNALPVSMTLLFMLGIANVLIAIPAQTYLQENMPEDLRGRVYGVLMTAINLASLLPVLLSGWIADFLGVVWVVFLVGVLTVSFGLYTIYHHKGWDWIENSIEKKFESFFTPFNNKDTGDHEQL